MNLPEGNFVSQEEIVQSSQEVAKKPEQNRQQKKSKLKNEEFRPSPHDTLFSDQISFLSQVR
jgi:hypothetical protein